MGPIQAKSRPQPFDSPPIASRPGRIWRIRSVKIHSFNHCGARGRHDDTSLRRVEASRLVRLFAALPGAQPRRVRSVPMALF
ncbi:protein of unknown function [Paraburkholderia kururiensis]